MIIRSNKIFLWYILKKLLSSSYSFVLGCSDKNQKQNLKERIEEFKHFKDDFGSNQFICKKIMGGI